MMIQRPQLTTLVLTLACAAVGCSSNRMTAQAPQSYSQHPDQQSVFAPGSADVAQGNELRHPSTVHEAYGRWQEQQKQLPQARESYQRALQHDPRSVDALLGLSRLDRHAGRIAEAEQHLAKAEKLRPNDPLIAASWGEHYSAIGRWPDAIRKYRYAVEHAPEEAVYKHQLAVAYTRSGSTADGLAMFSEIVAQAEAHYNVGYLLQQQGKLMEAEEQYQRALALKPNLAQAQNMLAQVRRERGVPVQPTQTAENKPVPTSTPIQPVGGMAPIDDVRSALWQSRSGELSSDQPQPPAGLTPQQLEQWRNQQALQGHSQQ